MEKMNDTFQDLKSLLHTYNPADRQEQDHKQTILAFLNEYPYHAFERSLDVGHITASSWLVNKDGSQALLTHHKKLDKWLQLGGHCDGNTNVLAVAIKEAQEESGILGIKAIQSDIFDISVHLIPENKKEKAHYHYDIRFLLGVVTDEHVVVSDESHDLAWISKDRYCLPTNEISVIRMFDKWVNYF